MKNYENTCTHYITMTVGVCLFIMLWVLSSVIIANTLYEIVVSDRSELRRCIFTFAMFSTLFVNFVIWFIVCMFPTTLIDGYFADKWMLKHGKVHVTWIN